MARDAGHLELVFVQVTLMAASTFQRLGRFVLADQREFGLLAVIEDALFPIFLIVASLTLRTELAFVRFVVILLMTRITQHRCVFELVVWVTFRTFHFFVLAQQLELGLIVIEIGHLPIFGGMAILTLVTQLTFVCFVIVFLMTAHASLGNTLVFAVDVALRTLHIDVFSDQLEFGFVVIEACALPIFFCVALGAVFTQLAFVRFFIVLLVAGVAHSRRFAEFLARLVAALTLHLLSKVTALQFIVSEFVVEFLVIEFCRFEIAAFVFGMALFTFFAGVDTAMVAFLIAHVLAHILMTIHTQLRLRLLVELLVTQLTLLFFFDVSFDDITGHQQLVRLRLQRQCEQETS